MNSSGGSSPKDHAVAPRKRFVLSGRSPAIDPVHDMVRDDLADVTLAERVFAPHYACAMTRTMARNETIRSKPRVDAEASGSAQLDETVEVFDVSGGWAWLRTVDAIGYVPADSLA